MEEEEKKNAEPKKITAEMLLLASMGIEEEVKVLPKQIFSSSPYDFEYKTIKNGEYQFMLLHSEKHVA